MCLAPWLHCGTWQQTISWCCHIYHQFTVSIISIIIILIPAWAYHHSHGHHHHPHHVIMGGGSATIAQWKTSVLPSSSWKWFQCLGGGDWGWWWWWSTKYKNVCIHERLRSGANADPRYDWCCLEILLSGILQKKLPKRFESFEEISLHQYGDDCDDNYED